MQKHVNELLAIPGAKLLFGGKELMDGEHDIPKCYGALQPTAVFVPLRKLASRRYFDLCTKEVFGPVQVVTEYKGKDLDVVLNCLERMTAHLTAAVVSNDPEFTYVCPRPSLRSACPHTFPCLARRLASPHTLRAACFPFLRHARMVVSPSLSCVVAGAGTPCWEAL
ncbi:hypothetical protein EON66_06100 [archaeon]|nr:MAG: hypothetical protein EON66_06100 [archaeon]